MNEQSKANKLRGAVASMIHSGDSAKAAMASMLERLSNDDLARLSATCEAVVERAIVGKDHDAAAIYAIALHGIGTEVERRVVEFAKANGAWR